MLIKMTVGLSGPAYCLSPGDERDFPQDEAVRLIEAGFAVPVDRPNVERTVSIDVLRAEYRSLFGKRPFNGWDAATLREKIAEQR